MSPHNFSERMLEGAQAGALQLVDPAAGGRIFPDGLFRYASLKTTGAETRTVTDPTAPMQRLLLTLTEDGGDCVVTFDSAINAAGNTVATFGDVGDTLELLAIPTANPRVFRWDVATNNGAVLS